MGSNKYILKTKIPRYPVKVWQGKFDAMLFRTYANTRTPRRESRRLQGFLDQFPGYTGLEQFTITEVVTYIKWRVASNAAYNTLLHELATVRFFFNWLIESQNLPLINPVRRDFRQNLKRRYALLMEAKSVRERFGDIKFSPSDVGSSVGDEGDIFSFIAGVTEPEDGSKG